MFDRFSDEARRTVVRALAEARRQGHDHVGTEHVLVALVGARGAAGNALASEGITVERAQQASIDVGGRGGRVSPWDEGPYTSRTRHAFELAKREAYEFGHRYIASGHLLLALLRIGDGDALRVLDHLGVDPEVLRQKIEDSISTERPPVAPGERLAAVGIGETDGDIASAEALLTPPTAAAATPAPAPFTNGRTVLSLGDDGPLLTPVAVDSDPDDADDDDPEEPGDPYGGLPDDDVSMGPEANGHHVEVDLRSPPRVTVHYDDPPEAPVRPRPVGRRPEVEAEAEVEIDVVAFDHGEQAEDDDQIDDGHGTGPELEPWQCSFCGRDLGDDDRFVAGADAVICSGCVQASARLLGLGDMAGAGDLDPGNGWSDPAPPDRALPRVEGTTPAGVSVADVARAFVVALDLGQPDDQRAAHIEDGGLLAPILAWAREQRPAGTPATSTTTGTVVDKVRFLNDELALVHFASDLTAGNGANGSGSGEPATRPGWARRHSDGWKVTRETYTRLLRDAGLPPL